MREKEKQNEISKYQSDNNSDHVAADFYERPIKTVEPRKRLALWICLAIFIATGVAFVVFEKIKNNNVENRFDPFTFPNSSNKLQTLEESGSMKKSASSDWWLNSGGLMNIDKSQFRTNAGALPKNNKWRKLYTKTNPTDTDEGYYPQNIFRLVTKRQYQNLSQKVYFNIADINLSESENRSESNGVLLFNRYQDGDNLYYTGLRVDGAVVIKKKLAEKYYTLAEKHLFTGSGKYSHSSNPNLIPTDKWIGIKSEVITDDNGAVDIRLFIDRDDSGNWNLELEKKDMDNVYGKTAITKQGYAGIRSDFMDVAFKDYSVQEVPR